MDELDKKILQELSKNGRKAFSKIGKKLGVSAQTVMRRYYDMKANGTIALLAVAVDLEKIGYAGTAHLFIKTKPNASSAQTVEQLSKTPNVITAVCAIGSYDIYGVLAFEEINEFYEKILKIKNMASVLVVDFSVAMPGIRHFPPISDPF